MQKVNLKHLKRQGESVSGDFELIHRVTLSKYAGDGKTMLGGFDSQGAQISTVRFIMSMSRHFAF